MWIWSCRFQTSDSNLLVSKLYCHVDHMILTWSSHGLIPPYLFISYLQLETFIQKNLRRDVANIRSHVVHNQTATMLEIGTNLLTHTAEQTRKLNVVEAKVTHLRVLAPSGPPAFADCCSSPGAESHVSDWDPASGEFFVHQQAGEGAPAADHWDQAAARQKQVRNQVWGFRADHRLCDDRIRAPSLYIERIGVLQRLAKHVSSSSSCGSRAHMSVISVFVRDSLITLRCKNHLWSSHSCDQRRSHSSAAVEENTLHTCAAINPRNVLKPSKFCLKKLCFVLWRKRWVWFCKTLVQILTRIL